MGFGDYLPVKKGPTPAALAAALILAAAGGVPGAAAGVLAALGVAAAGGLESAAPSPGRPEALTLHLHLFPPFVTGSEGSYTGFDMELWEALDRNLDIPYSIVEHKTLPALLEAVRTGVRDVGLAGITIASQRERELDFTYAYHNSGLGILHREMGALSWGRGLMVAFTPRIRMLLLGMLVFVVVSAHLIWYFERGKDAIDDRYPNGVLEGAWWTIVTMSTVGYGDIAPKRWTGRLVGVVVIISGIAFFGIAVAELSSTFALQNLKKRIEGPSDLKRLRVAAVTGTTGEGALRNRGVAYRGYPDLQAGYGALASGEVEALVHDRPALQYLTREQSGEGLRLSPAVFEPQAYGIALPQGSALRERINQALLEIMESGELDKIQSKWFDAAL